MINVYWARITQSSFVNSYNFGSFFPYLAARRGITGILTFKMLLYLIKKQIISITIYICNATAAEFVESDCSGEYK
jgi:hypothetical protein